MSIPGITSRTCQGTMPSCKPNISVGIGLATIGSEGASPHRSFALAQTSAISILESGCICAHLETTENAISLKLRWTGDPVGFVCSLESLARTSPSIQTHALPYQSNGLRLAAPSIV